MKTLDELMQRLETIVMSSALSGSPEYKRQRCRDLIQLYSDQQNKELEEKLMSEQIENGYLQGFRVSNEAEIQRLTKEVERLKLRCDRAVQFAGSMGGENTRLREEVEELKKDKESLEKQAATFSHVHKMLNDRIKEDAKEIESLQKAPKIGTDCKKELTRLRSLLERCKSVLDPSNRYYTNLLSEIEKASPKSTTH